MERIGMWLHRKHTYIHTYLHMHIHIHTYTHTHIYTYIHTYIHKRTHTYIHTYIHAHLRIHTHTLKSCAHLSMQQLNSSTTSVPEPTECALDVGCRAQF